MKKRMGKQKGGTSDIIKNIIDSFKDNNNDIYFDLIAQVNNINEIVDYIDEYGKQYNFSLLMAAVYYNNIEVVNDLIGINAEINITNTNGDNAFMIAIKSPNDYYGLYDDMYEIMELLIENGANINIVNNNGESPLYIASKIKRNPETIKLLVENSVQLDPKTLAEYESFSPKVKQSLSGLMTHQAINANNTNLETRNIPGKIKTINPENPTNNNYYEPPKNAVSFENIENGNTMINFHDEFSHKRFYKKNTYKALPIKSNGKKENPHTRQPIDPTTITKYKTHIVKNAIGGKSRKASRKSKRKTRKH
jgi:ankyrin repeat protein